MPSFSQWNNQHFFRQRSLGTSRLARIRHRKDWFAKKLRRAVLFAEKRRREAPPPTRRAFSANPSRTGAFLGKSLLYRNDYPSPPTSGFLPTGWITLFLFGIFLAPLYCFGMDIGANKRIGINLKKMRVAAGLTQAETAERLNVPQSMISKLESGERGMRFYEVFAYAEALNLQADELFCDVKRHFIRPQANDTHRQENAK